VQFSAQAIIFKPRQKVEFHLILSAMSRRRKRLKKRESTPSSDPLAPEESSENVLEELEIEPIKPLNNLEVTNRTSTPTSEFITRDEELSPQVKPPASQPSKSELPKPETLGELDDFFDDEPEMTDELEAANSNAMPSSLEELEEIEEIEEIEENREEGEEPPPEESEESPEPPQSIITFFQERFTRLNPLETVSLSVFTFVFLALVAFAGIHLNQRFPDLSEKKQQNFPLTGSHLKI